MFPNWKRSLLWLNSKLISTGFFWFSHSVSTAQTLSWHVSCSVHSVSIVLLLLCVATDVLGGIDPHQMGTSCSTALESGCALLQWTLSRHVQSGLQRTQQPNVEMVFRKSWRALLDVAEHCWNFESTNYFPYNLPKKHVSVWSGCWIGIIPIQLTCIVLCCTHCYAHMYGVYRTYCYAYIHFGVLHCAHFSFRNWFSQFYPFSRSGSLFFHSRIAMCNTLHSSADIGCCMSCKLIVFIDNFMNIFLLVPCIFLRKLQTL